MNTALLDHAPAEVADGSVRSADGTRIGYRRVGSGPATVFVHGSVSMHTDWRSVVRLLAGQFTCYAMDRRGRAKSGEGVGPYSIEREYEDIAAVLAAAKNESGAVPALVAHSFGAICALGAAMRYPVTRLVLYEPPFPVGGLIAGANLPPYAAAVAANDLDKAMAFGLASFPRLSAPEIAALRASRGWPLLCSFAKSWIRELEAMDALSPNLECYRALACPSMLVMGDKSPEHPMLDAARALIKVLPGVRVECLAGQGHGAMRSAPDRLARLIRDFLSA
ncbi:MAG: alpha/beta hydrolase [Terracidiphilus sp.]